MNSVIFKNPLVGGSAFKHALLGIKAEVKSAYKSIVLCII